MFALLNVKLHQVLHALRSPAPRSSNPTWGRGRGARQRALCGDPPHLHMNGATLMQAQEESTGRGKKKKKNAAGGLLIMHLFAKQINRAVTQTNISHREARRRIPPTPPKREKEPERRRRRERRMKTAKVCLFRSARNIHTAETRNSPAEETRPRPRPAPEPRLV